MKAATNSACKGLYLLTLLTLILPWFTYNASMMGYCWGYQFLLLFALPCCMTGLFLFKFPHSIPFRTLGQLSALANLGILVYALGCWQTHCNIRSGFHFLDGLHTALPTYWLSLGLHSAFFLLLILPTQNTTEESQ